MNICNAFIKYCICIVLLSSLCLVYVFHAGDFYLRPYGVCKFLLYDSSDSAMKLKSPFWRSFWGRVLYMAYDMIIV